MATDKRLDQVSNLTDFDYALIVKGTDVAKVTKQQLAELVGNLLYGATTKEALASVVAGLLRENSLYPFMYRGQVNDLNTATKAGFYLASQNAANSPTYYPMVFVFEISNLYVQIAKELTANGNLYVRTNSGATWKSWDKVTTTVV